MELRRELLLTVVTLVGLNLLLAFGSIGLFVRMGPAIDRILKDNVYSIEAAEQIVSQLAMAGATPLSEPAQLSVLEALHKLRNNITEQDEGPAIELLSLHLERACEGDATSKTQVIESSMRLIAINREAMEQVDLDARHLGVAGAWAAVFVGFLSFLLSILIIVRLQTRFVRPLVDLHEVLEGASRGDRLRRCKQPDAPREVIQVAEAVNRLLDERATRAIHRADLKTNEEFAPEISSRPLA